MPRAYVSNFDERNARQFYLNLPTVFDWETAPQGAEFWFNVHEAFCHDCAWPQIITGPHKQSKTQIVKGTRFRPQGYFKMTSEPPLPTWQDTYHPRGGLAHNLTGSMQWSSTENAGLYDRAYHVLCYRN